MGKITLLDYGVFEALKAALGREKESVSDSFSESVLGYGFLAGKGDPSPVEFILLCHPSSCGNLKTSIDRAMAENPFSVEGIPILVSVRSSGPAHDLAHSLTLSTDNPIPDAIDPVNDDLSEWVQISLGQTLRQVVLNEHRKIVLPSYLLRYAPFTSPNLIILRAALSQIHYLHQSGSLSNEFEQRTVSARMSDSAQNIPISRLVAGFSRTMMPSTAAT